MNAEADAWKDEERRQATELAVAIRAAIDTHAEILKKQSRQPILNAVAGALVTVEGGMLAAIEDPRHRKAMRHAMERALPSVIASTRATGNFGKPVVVVIGGLKH